MKERGRNPGDKGHDLTIVPEGGASMESVEQLDARALTLCASNPEAGQATLPVRWCLSKWGAEQLRQKGVLKPWVLLAVFHGGTETSRHVVPLEQCMQYVQFHGKGGTS